MKRSIPLSCFFVCLSVIFVCWSKPSQAYEVGGFDWKPTFSVDETYDNNIRYAEDNEIGDFITTFSPGVIGVYEGKTSYASLKGALHEKVYGRYNEFNNLSEDLAGIYKQDLSKFDHFLIKDSFLHADQTSSFDEELGRVSGRYGYYKNILNTNFAHDFSSQFTGMIHFDNDYYDPGRADLVGSVQNMFGVETDYSVSSKIVPFWFYDYSTRSYSPGGTMNRNSTGLGGKYYLTEQLYANAKIGADFIQPVVGDDIVRPQYFLGLTDELDPTTIYGASFIRHYEDSAYDQKLLNDWRFSLNWGKQVLERLQAIVSAFTGGGKFEPDGAKERLNGIGVVFNYEATPNSTVSVGTTFVDKNSNDDTRDYNKNTVSLAWKLKF
jgi:hypothetical protein